MLVTPWSFFLYLLESQSKCECWVLFCIQQSFHGQVVHCLGVQAWRKHSLPVVPLQLAGRPKASCCPTEGQEKQAGPQRWLCRSLNVTTLCLLPGGPCSKIGNLLFRNLSVCGKGLCFKVFSLLKGVLFNFREVRLLYQGTRDTRAVLCCWRWT